MWITEHATETGILAEQLNLFDGSPLSVSPLTWTHATFVVTFMIFVEKARALDLALRIDETVKQVRSDDWRVVEPRERAIKQALYDIVKHVYEVECIFLIIKAQKEY